MIASVLVGEREAFDILLSRYSSSVLRLCTALLGNTFEAQDIAQEASLQAFLGLARLQEPARFFSRLLVTNAQEIQIQTPSKVECN